MLCCANEVEVSIVLLIVVDNRSSANMTESLCAGQVCFAAHLWFIVSSATHCCMRVRLYFQHQWCTEMAGSAAVCITDVGRVCLAGLHHSGSSGRSHQPKVWTGEHQMFGQVKIKAKVVNRLFHGCLSNSSLCVSQ